MNTLQQVKHDVLNALHNLAMSYEILDGAPPVSIDASVRDSREAMQRLQIAHENYIRAHEEKHDNSKR